MTGNGVVVSLPGERGGSVPGRVSAHC
jgi:hypothetical protein